MEKTYLKGSSHDIRPIRTIVTGTGANGRSRILHDGHPEYGPPFMGISGFAVTDLWQVHSLPVDNSSDIPPPIAAGEVPIAPPKGGLVFRTTQFPPETEWRSADTESGSAHPHMHATATLDFAIVLEGEIYAVLDDDETLMRSGDTLIQRGTNHAWANRSGAPCTVVFVMIDANAGEA